MTAAPTLVDRLIARLERARQLLALRTLNRELEAVRQASREGGDIDTLNHRLYVAWDQFERTVRL